ncbi:MAG: GFA family protein [Amphiplicatus sp.]
MTTSQTLSGGCHCGAVRYASQASPPFSIICCCTQCQKITGAGRAPQFALPKATVTVDGTLAFFDLKADSGNAVQSAFCPACGSPVYKSSSGFADFLFFHAATLDDPSQYQPQRVVWARSRQPWDHLDPALPMED